jgi:hypothetical protein
MKPLVGIAVVSAAAAIGLALGVALRQPFKTERLNEGEYAPKSLRESKHAARVLTRSGRKEDGSALMTQLESDLAASSGVTRWLFWFEAMEKAPLSDFPRLAQLAAGDRTALRLLALRWMELDAQGLFNALVEAERNGSGLFEAIEHVLIGDWAKRDPESLIRALDEAPAFGKQHRWRYTLAADIAERDPELGLRMSSKWQITSHGPRSEGFRKWAAQDPRHAAEFTLTHRAGFASRIAMEAIGTEWGKTDPTAALEFAAQNRDELGSVLAQSALKTWSERNLAEAGEWLANADAATRNRLSPAFVEIWAKNDPARALTWCEENLSGTSLSQAAAGVLKGAAEKDVAAAARLVEVMKASSARTAGAVAVAEKWIPQLQERRKMPTEAVDWLKRLDDESIRKVLSQLQWAWSNSDPGTLAAFLEATDVENIPQYVYTVVVRDLARKDPRQAIDWTNKLRDEKVRVDAGAEAFVEWQRGQPELAMQWLNELPSADPRRKAFFENTVRHLAWDAHATEKFAALAVQDRETARKVVEGLGLAAERRERLLGALGSEGK